MRNDDIEQELANIEKEIIAYKSSQAISGDSWRVYTYLTNNTADFVIGPPVAGDFNKLYIFKYYIPGQIPNAFCIMNVQPLEYNTGIFMTQQNKYDDPTAKYIRLKYNSANGVPAANSYIRLKVRVQSPFQGTLQITEVV